MPHLAAAGTPKPTVRETVECIQTPGSSLQDVAKHPPSYLPVLAPYTGQLSVHWESLTVLALVTVFWLAL
jgi:hypothetical protein